ncbi:type II secretion system protein [Hydrogenophaga sp.]|uniref:type II secretion system protein n=1 Tax=Hydrogenophaga sp. TaxID=1904254 RepID=UPI0026142F1B|nr:type II secretion system protein [Hydrogenophaga sp.]MDM7948583.1 type II secretion system protein [Hydrogenophaga sp.]
MTSGERAPWPRSASNPRAHQRRSAQRGVGFLMVLLAVAAIGFSLAGAGQVQHTLVWRDKEAQLLFIGQQFRAALASYRDRSPVGTPTAPTSLDALLEDQRFPQPVHHLRRRWRDPMTNTDDWGLLMADGRIVGVHSRSTREPLRTAFDSANASLAGLGSYDQWVFTAAAPARPLAEAANANPPAGTRP